MSCQSPSELANAFAERRLFSFHAFVKSVVNGVRNSIRHRKQQQELLDYIASDHRAAADLGISIDTLRNWPRQRFWRD